MAELQFRVDGLTYLDKLELEEQLQQQVGSEADNLVEYEVSTPPEGAFGEPVTLAVILGGIALKGLIAWWVLRNRKDRFKERIEIRLPNGTWVTYTVEFEIAKDQPLSEQVLQALSDLSGLPIPQLTG